MANYLKQMMKIIVSFERKPSLENVEFDQEYWDSLYTAGRWGFLHNLSELAHYSVIVGYCQYFAPEGSFLEIGCGEAILQQRLQVLPYQSYTGVDISAEAIDKAMLFQDNRTRFIAGDAFELTIDEKFDIIMFNESLYCFNDCISVLDHFSTMLTENGVFVVSMHDQAVSKEHWKRINDKFLIIDSVSIANKKGVKWQCKALKPS